MSETPPTVHLNDQALAWQAGQSVAELLAQQADTPDSVATALNGEFIARAQRASTLLRPGDRLSVFKAIVGG